MSTLQEILENLDANAPMSLLEIVEEEWSEWERSPEYKSMLDGMRYYRVKNDVLDRKRTRMDEDGRLVEEKNLADNRIPHGFVRKLVDQKTGYLLARPFMVDTANEKYQEQLDPYFDQDFRRQFKNLGKAAVSCGKAWLQAYITGDGDLAFKRIPSVECKPIWKDAEHTELAAMIRSYKEVRYQAKIKKTIRCVEFWSDEGLHYFEEEAGRLVQKEVQGHAFVTEDGEDGKEVEKPYVWERVPFICFKYNSEEQPLIDLIKKQVDDYDNRKSDNSNNLEDLPESTYIVKNYVGTGAAEFRKNINLYRVAFVDEEGGVDTVSLNINTEAYKNHMDQTRRDIYEFGRGVDTQSDRYGSNPTGIALRFLYADLDMDANDMESEFQAGLEQMLWFINQHLANTTNVDYSKETVTFTFNRDILINETEAVTNAKNSMGLISRKTIVSNHPWTVNTNEELEQIEQEEVDQMAKYENGQYPLPGGDPNDEE